jgi:hypothetical protein
MAAAMDTFWGGVPPQLLQLLVLIKNKTLFGANLIARSPPSTTQSPRSLEDQRRRSRSTSPLKEFLFPLHLLGEFVPGGSLEILGGVIRDYSCLCGFLAPVAFLGASNWVVDVCPKLRVRDSWFPPIPLLSGNELASVACSPENKVSLHGVGRLRVTTPLQHRRTSPQKEGTMGIHPRVSGLHLSVISFSYLYLTCLHIACLLVTCRKFT